MRKYTFTDKIKQGFTWTRICVAGMAVVVLCMGTAFHPAPEQDRPDLSTPEKSYLALVQVLKTGDADALPNIATQTGISSLVALYSHADFQEGLSALGQELEGAEPVWEPITEDIYVAEATENGHVHKMEFTREEPGWMLYHWQLGGGVR